VRRHVSGVDRLVYVRCSDLIGKAKIGGRSADDGGAFQQRESSVHRLCANSPHPRDDWDDLLSFHARKMNRKDTSTTADRGGGGGGHTTVQLALDVTICIARAGHHQFVVLPMSLCWLSGHWVRRRSLIAARASGNRYDIRPPARLDCHTDDILVSMHCRRKTAPLRRADQN